MDFLLTVIIQTSPLPSHPSTALIEALFRSFDRVARLKECNIIILCDGCEEEPSQIDGDIKSEKPRCKPNYKHGAATDEAATNYRLHLQLLQEKIDNEEQPFTPANDGSIRLLTLPYRHGSARAIAAAFDTGSITTPYVLIGQHDNFFVRDVPYLEELLRYMEREETKSWLQCVHFPSTATLNYPQKVKRRYDLDLEKYCRQTQSDALSGDFVPLVFWYGRTHIARTRYYTEMILSEHPLKIGDHLEETWGTTQLDTLKRVRSEQEDAFATAHSKYGNYVYFVTADGVDGQQEVLYHLSGRKVRAAATAASPSDDSGMIDSGRASKEHTFNPQGTSFTTARAAKAVVPGLEFIVESGSTSEGLDNCQATAKQRQKFRQKCFHCGEKGHSFKFCPSIVKGEESMPNLDVIDLSPPG